MSESVQGGTPGGGPPPADRSPGGGHLRVVLGLFVVPLLVVLACVAVFIGFGWIAYEKQSTLDYVNDLQAWWRPRRAQAAYELSKILVADPDALAREPGAVARVRTLYRETDDAELKRYLALVLGRTGDPRAVDLLLESLEEDPDSQVRIYALWALGTAADSRALPRLEAALADPDAGIRKTAAYALGELGEGGAVPALVPRLADPVADVRWNAALALARLGSDAGSPVLRQILDRRLSAQVPGITAEQQEEAMTAAVRAVAAVEGESARELLERLAREDPSLKVRQAAIEARRALDGGGQP